MLEKEKILKDLELKGIIGGEGFDDDQPYAIVRTCGDKFYIFLYSGKINGESVIDGYGIETTNHDEIDKIINENNIPADRIIIWN